MFPWRSNKVRFAIECFQALCCSWFVPRLHIDRNRHGTTPAAAIQCLRPCARRSKISTVQLAPNVSATLRGCQEIYGLGGNPKTKKRIRPDLASADCGKRWLRGSDGPHGTEGQAPTNPGRAAHDPLGPGARWTRSASLRRCGARSAEASTCARPPGPHPLFSAYASRCSTWPCLEECGEPSPGPAAEINPKLRLCSAISLAKAEQAS